jgi:hypothetical protein
MKLNENDQYCPKNYHTYNNISTSSNNLNECYINSIYTSNFQNCGDLSYTNSYNNHHNSQYSNNMDYDDSSTIIHRNRMTNQFDQSFYSSDYSFNNNRLSKASFCYDLEKNYCQSGYGNFEKETKNLTAEQTDYFAASTHSKNHYDHVYSFLRHDGSANKNACHSNYNNILSYNQNSQSTNKLNSLISNKDNITTSNNLSNKLLDENLALTAETNAKIKQPTANRVSKPRSKRNNVKTFQSMDFKYPTYPVQNNNIHVDLDDEKLWADFNGIGTEMVRIHLSIFT